MAVVTAVGAGVALAGGIAKSISGAKQARESKKAIENYRRQELRNVYENLEVSTLGADLQREEAGRLAATSVDALRQGGVRGLVGGLPGVIQQQNVLSRQIGADLDRQQQEIQRMQAEDAARIRQMQEQREREDLAGLGQQMEVGRQNLYSGISDVGSGLMSAGSMGQAGTFGNIGQGGQTPQVAPASQMTTGGLQSMGYASPIQPQVFTGTPLSQMNFSPMGFTRPQAPIYTGAI